MRVYRRCASSWRPSIVLIILASSTGPALVGEGVYPAAAGDAPAAPTRVYAGRSLLEALERLQALGLRLIFSSEVVHPDMIVQTEPPVASPRQVLVRLLAPFGLEARDGPAGTVLVLRAAAPEPGQAAGAAPAAGGREDHPDPSRSALRERVRVAASRGGDPEPATTLNRTDLQGPPAIGDDVSRALAWLPGFAPEDTSARFKVRGGGSDETLVILDGLEIDDPYHLESLLPFSSIVDARAIGHADVLTGIFPAEYGDRMSAVIGLSTFEQDEAARTVIGVSGVNASVLSEGRLGADGGNWLVSARSWRPNAFFETAGTGGEGSRPYDSDLLGKIQVSLPDGSLLSGHVLASHDDLEYQTDRGDGGMHAGEGHRYAWINWQKPWTSHLYSLTLVSAEQTDRARFGAGLTGTTAGVQVDDSRSFSSTRLKQDWIFAPAGRLSLRWGLDARALEAEYSYRSHVQPVMDPSSGGGTSNAIDRGLAMNPAGTEAGAYVSARYRLSAPVTVEAGVRHDRQSLTGESETSPRLNLAWALGDRSVLRAGWGLFYQPQGIDRIPVEDGVQSPSPAERARHWEVDLEHRSKGGLSWGGSAYRKDMDHLRPRYENLLTPFELFPELEPDRVRIAARRAVSCGLELKIARDRGRSLSWGAYYALASVEDRVDDAWVPRSWDQRHTVGFSTHWRRADTWEVALAGLYHSGWPTTEILERRVLGADGSIGIEPLFGARNVLRLPAYERLDLGIKRRYRLGDGTLALQADVAAFLGPDGVCCAQDLRYVPQADGSLRVVRGDSEALRQLAVAGLTWEF